MPSTLSSVGETVLLCVLLALVLLGPFLGPTLWRVGRRVLGDYRDRRGRRTADIASTGQLVDDLRRLARLQAELPPGTPWARQHGTQLAYDHVLVALCRAMDIDHDLDTLPMGLTRDVERLRVEDVLYGLGLRIHTVGT